jgi:hypothetical protein
LQQLHGGADAGFRSCRAACACAIKPRHEKGRGGEGGDAAEARDNQFGCCAAGKVKYKALCVQWRVNQWTWLRGGLLGMCSESNLNAWLFAAK